MNDTQLNRYLSLCAKMDQAKAVAGRTYTDTADLTGSERVEYRRLRSTVESLQEEYNEQQMAKLNRSMLSSFLLHD